MLNVKEHKVAENNICVFYVSDMTKSLDNWAKECGLKGVSCLIAEQKSDKIKDYIIMKDGEIHEERCEREGTD